MPVFISHSFDNKPEFDNIVDALELAQVPYWNPAEVKPGSSLRDQLRQAVERCSVCSKGAKEQRGQAQAF